jgi:hypothetical protein
MENNGDIAMWSVARREVGLMEEDDPGTHINAPESCRPPYRPIRSVATGLDL